MKLKKFKFKRVKSTNNTAIRIINKQGGNGFGLVVAALIIGGSIVYAINIWSNTKQQMIKAPAEAIQKGVESVKKAIQPGS